MCEWTSMMPGVTYLPVPSITTASAGAAICEPTATTLPSRIRSEASCSAGPAAVRIVACWMTVTREGKGVYVLGNGSALGTESAPGPGAGVGPAPPGDAAAARAGAGGAPGVPPARWDPGAHATASAATPIPSTVAAHQPAGRRARAQSIDALIMAAGNVWHRARRRLGVARRVGCDVSTATCRLRRTGSAAPGSTPPPTRDAVRAA